MYWEVAKMRLLISLSISNSSPSSMQSAIEPSQVVAFEVTHPIPSSTPPAFTVGGGDTNRVAQITRTMSRERKYEVAIDVVLCCFLLSLCVFEMNWRVVEISNGWWALLRSLSALVALVLQRNELIRTRALEEEALTIVYTPPTPCPALNKDTQIRSIYINAILTRNICTVGLTWSWIHFTVSFPFIPTHGVFKTEPNQ